jgi:alpha-beta hydrolase superfamily lysophospholipase
MTITNHYPITDWDDAYANANHITNGQGYIQQWQEAAQDFRDYLMTQGRAELTMAYGSKVRNQLDLFLPQTAPIGLIVIVHGGYWLRFDKSYWSHLAKGGLDAGYAVAMPSYTLCPEASIADIVQEIGAAISLAATKVAGEIRLTGHSAGGHLVTSMICEDSPLDKNLLKRIRKTVSISGLHDLRPLLNTTMNKELQLDQYQAAALSPVLKIPKHLAPLTCWVGSDERPEFLRLNKLQADIWKSFSMVTDTVEEANKHHFNVIEGLTDEHHPLMQSLLSND